MTDETVPKGQAEGRMRERLQAAEQLADIGSWEWVPDTGELNWSDNLYRLVGIEPGAVTPTPQLVLDRTHLEDRERQAREVARVRKGATAQKFDFRIVRPDGSVRHLRSQIASVEDRDGGPRRVVGCVQDITEQLRAEAEIAAHVALREALVTWGGLEQGGRQLLSALAESMGFSAAGLWTPDEGALRARVTWSDGSDQMDAFEAETRRLRLPAGVGLPGVAWESRQPTGVQDVTEAPWFRRHTHAARAGIRGGLAVPALSGDEVLAVIDFYARDPIELSERLKLSLAAIGGEIGDFLARHRGELSSRLTPRELEVLELAGTGHAGPAIAELLVISPATVKTHFEHLYEKLGVSDRAAAVAAAIRAGLIE